MRRGRPKKVRYIQNMPGTVQFSPRGKPGRPDEVEITIDEFEAIKLADYQRFNQEQGAAAMRISRPSFGRILKQARQKVSDAVVNGKIIRIRMGAAQVGFTKANLTPDTFDQEIKRFKARNEKVLREAARISRPKTSSVIGRRSGRSKKTADMRIF